MMKHLCALQTCLLVMSLLALPAILSATGPIAARDTRPSLYDRNRRDTDQRGSRSRQISSSYMPTSPYYTSESFEEN